MDTAVQHRVDELQQFLQAFRPNKFKFFSRGLEVRGLVDIHGSIQEAKQIISLHKLSLVVVHTAEMVAFRGFEVQTY
jgi:hypothetical protein